jgi:hypothetical protein
MRRLLLLAAALLATACAGKQKPLAPAPGTEAAGPAAPAAPGVAKSGEVLAEYDLNHDGKADVWKYTVADAAGKERVTRREKDLNGDGKIDCWETYAADGTLARLVYDMDFDGKPDVTLIFEKDQLVRKEYAFGFDGVPHSFNFYEKGKLVRKERDANGDGRIDTWEYWEGGEVDRIGTDLDGDGVVDKWEARRASASAEAAPAKDAQK